MSEQQAYELQKSLDEIKSGQEKLFQKLSYLEERVYKDHDEKLKELKDMSPSEKDIERFHAVAEALGNWKFLLKFFAILGTVFTGSVTMVYYLVELIKAIR